MHRWTCALAGSLLDQLLPLPLPLPLMPHPTPHLDVPHQVALLVDGPHAAPVQAHAPVGQHRLLLGPALHRHPAQQLEAAPVCHFAQQVPQLGAQGGQGKVWECHILRGGGEGVSKVMMM